MPLPSQFSDVAKSAVECWDSHISYTFSSDFLRSQLDSSEFWTSTTYATPITETDYYTQTLEDCTTSYPGLTTLCDKFPRASSCILQCTQKGTSISTRFFTDSGTGSWYRPTWSTEIEQLPKPTCTVAVDLSHQCSRLAEAYDWRTSHIPDGNTVWYVPPRCDVFLPPPATKRCSFKADSYEAYYWPTPKPSDPNAFCSPNATAPPATPTIPGRPNTAVVSGFTLTSPYVYHILHNATVFSFAGRASPIDGGPIESLWSVSSAAPTMTLSQASSSLLSLKEECHRPSPHGARRCTWSYDPDFRIQDMLTVRASAYYTTSDGVGSTICQSYYHPRIGLPLNEIASQNGVEEGCDWTSKPSGGLTIIGKDILSVGGFTSSDYHVVTATGVPSPGSKTTLTSVATPTGEN